MRFYDCCCFVERYVPDDCVADGIDPTVTMYWTRLFVVTVVLIVLYSWCQNLTLLHYTTLLPTVLCVVVCACCAIVRRLTVVFVLCVVCVEPR